MVPDLAIACVLTQVVCVGLQLYTKEDFFGIVNILCMIGALLLLT